MTRIHTINKLLISKNYHFEEVCDNAKKSTHFHSNNSIIYTSQFHSTYGSIMPSLYFSSGIGYRYGFNGKEMDNEVKGVANQVAYELRIYDARLGRWLSTDPRESEYAWQSTYAYYANSPIAQIDYMGGGGNDENTKLTPPSIAGNGEGQLETTTHTEYLYTQWGTTSK